MIKKYLYSLKYSTLFFCLSIMLISQQAMSHTISIGYENAGAGTVNFWYGSYHSAVNYTEGSLQLTGPNSFSSTVSFSLITNSKPAGLVDGTTNFFSNGSALIGTYNNSNGPLAVWQGAQISGLVPGTYTFTYIPISSPTSVWAPIDSVILSSTVLLSSSIVGSSFVSNSSPSSSDAAEILDSISNSATGDMADVITTLQGLSDSEQHAALQRIAPQTGQAMAQASSQAISGALDSVSVRLDNIRTQGYTGTLAEDLSRGKSIQVASLGDLQGLLSSEPYLKNNFWTKVFGAYATQGMDAGFNGYNSRTGGAAVGADTLLENNWIVGGAFTYSTTKISMDDYRTGDSDDINSYQLTGYTSRDFGKWYIEGMLAYALQDFTTARDTGVSGVAEGSFRGDQYATRLTAGIPIILNDKLTFTPTAGIEINYLRENGYTEVGGGPLSMTVDSVSATRVRSSLGPKLAMEKQWGSYKIDPSFHLIWRHEFNNSGIDSTATFTGGGAAFTTPGQNLNPDTFNFGSAVSISRDKGFVLTFQLDTEQGLHYSGYAGQILGQWKF